MDQSEIDRFWDTEYFALRKLSLTQLRLREAEAFVDKFRKASGPPDFHLLDQLAYLDASLMAIVSIKDLVDEKSRKFLHESELFTLLQALRNMTAHRFVLGQEPLVQSLGSATVDGSGASTYARRPYVAPVLMRRELDRLVCAEPSRWSKLAEGATKFLEPYLSGEKSPPYFDDLLDDGVSLMKAALKG